jgi:hypothetical protein
LSTGPKTAFACRKCWSAVYDDKRRPLTLAQVLARSLGTEPDPVAELEEQLEYLTATRRRGVRRGRRVRRRAIGLLLRIVREKNRMAATL